MPFPRAAGVLLHPTSLPGPNGIGEFGPDAIRFLDTLVEAGIRVWQMLPLGPTGFGDSPYQCFSAFAGNPLLIHLPGAISMLPAEAVDFAQVIPHKQQLLAGFLPRLEPDEQFRAFVGQHSEWLEDYALFMALKQVHNGAAWTTWSPEFASRDTAAIDTFRITHASAIQYFRVEQYVFARQFQSLRRACTERGIRLMGDLPIYVAHDSADVWANREQFQLDDAGHPRVQAGVPPDYFSETGQLWGNPIYNWPVMRDNGYRWWTARMRAAINTFDMVRIDHFRGFESYWEVPGADTTAINGQWVKGPGADLFRVMSAELGPLPIVAENLGLITPEVEALREQLKFPGMSVLQFAFGKEGTGKEHQPHRFTNNHVVYTGTHDNDTALGWWHAQPDATHTADDIAERHTMARRYLGVDGHDMHWSLIHAALASVADTALVPMQDILGLGTEARMNLPGRASGNWSFRFTWDQLTPEMITRLRQLTRLFDR